jgi:hypothetical protein
LNRGLGRLCFKWRGIRQEESGGEAMFLMRCAFWLGLVVLLLPPAGEEPPPRVSLLETAWAAQAFAQDFGGMCERNPAACAASREAMELVGRKLQTGAKIVQATLSAPGGAERGSLTDADLAAPWAVPRPRGG